MRYDTACTFVREGTKTYDASTGNYIKTDPTESVRYVSVSRTADAVQQIVYGGLKQGSLTIHLQNHYNEPYDYVVIGGKKYRADRVTPLRVKMGIVISEVL